MSVAQTAESLVLERHSPALEPIVSIRDLHVTFRRKGRSIHAVRGVDLDLKRGEILGLVGESGSGKSALSSAMLGLLPRKPRPEVRGQILVEGVDMVGGSERTRRELRRDKLGAVFQDPMTSLNPTMRIGRQVIESTGSESEALRLLEAAGVPDPERRMRSYPHELSGGLRQRVMVAMAIGNNPSLVVADEPTTALDVTVQAQILALLSKLRTELGLSIVFITHDLAVASQVADRVAVMYAGKLVELGTTRDVLDMPAHPYSGGLVASRLTITMRRDQPIATLPGEPPDAALTPTACAFLPRCSHASQDCEQAPALKPVLGRPGDVACYHPLLAGAPKAEADPLVLALLAEPHVPDAERGTVLAPKPALEVLEVTKSFQLSSGKARHTLQALDGVSLAVAPGESIAVVGESGCGKSTLLRVMAGLISPDSGEVVLTPHEQPQMIFQDAGASLTPWLTVEELVSERLRSHVSDRRQRHEMVLETLQLVGCPVEFAGARAGELSGGQRQRVAIARAVVRPPSVLLCDEPTSALDVSLAATVLNLLGGLRRRLGMSIVFVTHDLAAARIVADRIAVMNSGQVVEIGDVEDVCQHPSSSYTQSLLASMPQIPTPQNLDLNGRIAG